MPVFGELRTDDPERVGGYSLVARLGAGGMGTVYLSHTLAGRPVAIKAIRPELADDAEFRRRFRREVAAARRVQGLYTAAVIDSQVDGSLLWLATAFVPGPTLATAVSRHGALPVSSVLLLAAGVAEALQEVHGEGIVHRDLKPSNVLLATDGPRVIDFGIARAADATALTNTGVAVGTPTFMSPEQAVNGEVGPATDVFSLGQLVTYAAKGTPAFGEGQAYGVLYRIVHEEPDLADVPEALLPVLTRCLTKDPEQRPSPADVIQLCRAASENGTLRRSGNWLPQAITVDVTQHQNVPTRAVPHHLPAIGTESARTGASGADGDARAGAGAGAALDGERDVGDGASTVTPDSPPASFAPFTHHAASGSTQHHDAVSAQPPERRRSDGETGIPQERPAPAGAATASASGSGNAAGQPHVRTVRRKVLVATAVSNFVVWFDFAAYGVMSVILAKVFFPQNDESVSVLATSGLFWSGVIARPIGAAFFGRYGDRIGRNRMLALSVLCMSGSTLLIGLLPSYAAAGIVAPLLLFLCRVVQGFSIGGEYTGAATFLTEYAPEGRRARYASLIPLTIGVTTATNPVLNLVWPSSAETLDAWGWRVLFLLAGALGLVGFYLRTRIPDTPVFRTVKQRGAVQKAPLREVVRRCRRQVLTLFGLSITSVVGYYLLTIYMNLYMFFYMTARFGFSKEQVMVANLLVVLVYGAACPLTAAASDRWGRKPMLLLACVGFAVLTVPALWLIGTGIGGLVVCGSVLIVLVSMIGTSSVPAMVEMFPPQLRASGSAIGYTAAYTLFGATAPLLLVRPPVPSSGSPITPGFYLLGLGAVSALVVVFAFRETLRLPLNRTTVEGD